MEVGWVVLERVKLNVPHHHLRGGGNAFLPSFFCNQKNRKNENKFNQLPKYLDGNRRRLPGQCRPGATQRGIEKPWLSIKREG